MIVFGPIPSRRLGQSLGVNNIPLKNCPYDCIYCQVGSTSSDALTKQAFYSPKEIFQSVQKRVKEVQAAGRHIDYLSIVPDGEPSLDLQLGTTIQALRPLGIKIAVITNASRRKKVFNPPTKLPSTGLTKSSVSVSGKRSA